MFFETKKEYYKAQAKITAHKKKFFLLLIIIT